VVGDFPSGQEGREMPLSKKRGHTWGTLQVPRGRGAGEQSSPGCNEVDKNHTLAWVDCAL
jgi:hypothetical protein